MEGERVSPSYSFPTAKLQGDETRGRMPVHYLRHRASLQLDNASYGDLVCTLLLFPDSAGWCLALGWVVGLHRWRGRFVVLAFMCRLFSANKSGSYVDDVPCRLRGGSPASHILALFKNLIAILFPFFKKEFAYLFCLQEKGIMATRFAHCAAMTLLVAAVVVVSSSNAAEDKPKYLVQVTGGSYPAPPSAYGIASLADVKSKDFHVAYNADGGVWMSATKGIDSCCILQVAEGWLRYDGGATSTSAITNKDITPVSLYNQPDGKVECFPEMAAQQIYLGTSATVFQTLSSEVADYFNTFTSETSQQWCTGMNASQTLLKRLD